jgi:hypothetical protein
VEFVTQFVNPLLPLLAFTTFCVREGFLLHGVGLGIDELSEFESESIWITVHEHAPRDDRHGVRW